MSLPLPVQSPATPLQQALYGLGFHWWWEFPAALFPQRTGFYPALATGLLCHIGQRYEQCWKAHEEWQQAISPIKAVNWKYEEQYGENKFGQVGYWQELAAECMKTCASVFAAEFKPDLEAVAISGQVKETAETSFYDKIAVHFATFLRIYEMTDDGPRVKDFHITRKGDFATYVNIAFDEESVLVLSHKDFEWERQDEAKFPNYTMIKDPGSEPPQFSNSPVFPRHPEAQVSTLIPTMGKLIDLLSQFVLADREHLPEGKDIQEALKGAVQDLEELGRERYDLTQYLGNAKKVLEIPIELPQPSKPRDPHTVLNCEDYPEAGSTEVHHTHRFHKDCLYRHLHSVSNDFSNGLKCPFPTCSTSLAENVLEVYPDIKQKYVDWKYQTMILHSVASLSATPQPCFHCKEVDVSATLLCGCKLCRRCSSNSYYGNMCVRCRNRIEEQDRRIISLLFERFKTT